MTAQQAKEVVVEKPVVPVFINTPAGTVAVYGHEHISKKDLTIFATALSMEEFDLESGGHGLYSIVLRTDGKPSFKGRQQYGVCCTDCNAIVLNISHMFNKAFEKALDRNDGTSIWTFYQRCLYLTFLHELHHVVAFKDVDEMPDKDAEAEVEAEKWAEETLYFMAQNYDIEPAHYSKSSYFCKQFYTMIDGVENDEWVADQKRYIEGHMYYKLEPKPGTHDGLVFTQFKPYLHFISGDPTNDKKWANKTTKNTTGEIIESLHDIIYEPTTGVTTPSSIDILAETLAEVNTPAPAPTPVQQAPAPVQPSMTQYANQVNPELYEDVDDYGDDGVETTNMAGIPELEGVVYSPAPAQTYTPAPAPAPVQPVFQPDNRYNQAPAPQQMPVQNTMPGHLPNLGYDPKYLGDVVWGVYFKMYNHIFGKCGQLLNSTVPFSNPDAVFTEPLQLTEEESKIIFKCDCMDENGKWHANMPTDGGVLRGYVSSKLKMPSYKVYINFNGVEHVRLLMPQNPNTGSKYAISAQRGSRILMNINGDDKAVAAGAPKWGKKIIDDQIVD